MHESCTENCFPTKVYNSGCKEPSHRALALEGIRGYQMGLKDGRDSRTPNYARATEIVRELFGRCNNSYISAATQENFPCGKCRDCNRDWTAEAMAIVDASREPISLYCLECPACGYLPDTPNHELGCDRHDVL